MAFDKSTTALYNIQIEMNDSSVHLLKGFNYEQIKAFQKSVWQNGFMIETNIGICWQLHDPLDIKQIFVMKQTPEILP